MVDDDLVTAIGTEGGLNGLGDCTACFYVAEDRSILRFVACGNILVGFLA